MRAVMSAAGTASQTPESPSIRGRVKRTKTMPSRLRANDIRAEVRPSEMAVKKPEMKRLKPQSRNESEKSRKPWCVS